MAGLACGGQSPPRRLPSPEGSCAGSDLPLAGSRPTWRGYLFSTCSLIFSPAHSSWAECLWCARPSVGMEETSAGLRWPRVELTPRAAGPDSVFLLTPSTASSQAVEHLCSRPGPHCSTPMGGVSRKGPLSPLGKQAGDLAWGMLDFQLSVVFTLLCLRVLSPALEAAGSGAGRTHTSPQQLQLESRDGAPVTRAPSGELKGRNAGKRSL